MAPRSEREPGIEPSEAASVRALAEEARQVKHPDPSEYARLLTAASLGNQEARERLLRVHLDWVVAAAGQRQGRGLAAGDLVQEGSIGLLAAIDRFDEDGGGREFGVFAQEAIGVQMDRALDQERQAELDKRLLVKAAEEYERAEIRVRRELGRRATVADLAQKLEWSLERTEEIRGLVENARRRHDEDLLPFLDPDEINLDALLDHDVEPDQGGDGA